MTVPTLPPRSTSLWAPAVSSSGKRAATDRMRPGIAVHAAMSDCARRRSECGTPASDLAYVVDPDTSGYVEDARGRIFLPVVDDMRGTAGAGAFRLFRRADRRDHPCPSPGCELHRVMTDRSGAASHQKRLAL